MESRFQKSTLPSGITLLTQTMPDRYTVSLGVWVRTGARHETPERLGISHFIEHMMFKGTETRDARAIASSLESLGGQLDAFTSREQVCYSARVLSEHVPQAVDVLSDIVCRSRFAAVEVEREKSVVREEILSYEDNPDDKVNEILSEQLWGDHPLGRPILGTVPTVDAFDPDALRAHFQGRYRADQLVVAGAGGLEHAALAELIDRWFSPPAGELPMPVEPPPPFRAGVRHIEQDVQQLYIALGTRGVSYSDPDRYALFVLETLLGGGMSSRLFQSIREEAGLAYSVFSTLDFYRDAGALGIQLGVSPERGREALKRLREELEQLYEHGATPEEVAAAKAQLKGSVVIGQESVSSRMYHMSRQELYRGEFMPPEEQVRRILEVTLDEVNALARRFVRPGQYTLVALGPANGTVLTEADWPVEAAPGEAAA